MNRRGLLLGLLAAPAIIRTSGLLMPIHKPNAVEWWTYEVITKFPNASVLIHRFDKAIRLASAPPTSILLLGHPYSSPAKLLGRSNDIVDHTGCGYYPAPCKQRAGDIFDSLWSSERGSESFNMFHYSPAGGACETLT